MPKKKSTAPVAAITTIKKGEIYETKQQELLEVANGRLKDEGELGTSFEGRLITFDVQTAKVVHAKTTDRYYLDNLSSKLSKAEFEEWVEAGKREAEATVVTTEKPAKAKSAKAKAKKADGDKKMSALDAAAKVLTESGTPMTTKLMIEMMSAKGYWTSPGGQTPAATLYAAILREINTKENDSRFTKTDRGHFGLNPKAAS